MKCPTFFEGVTLALAVSIGGSLLASIFSTVLPANMVLHLLIAGPAFVYVIYLLSRSKERTGRVTVIAVWCVAAASIWVFSPSFVMYAVLHLILIWLVRSLYFYSSVLSALTDMGLSGLGLLTAVWAGSWTGSIFLSLWCFFLIQALFVFIPTSWRGRTFSTMETPVTENPFDIAHRAAEAAVRKLSQ
jgi:hypothetical protein